MSNSNNTKYFASLESQEAVNEINQKAEDWGSYYVSNNYLAKLRKSWRYYYGNHFQSGAENGLSFAGEQTELVQFPVNHYRNIGLHLLNLTTANRPSLQARASNTDYKTFAQTILANGLLDYYMRERNLEDYLKTATESAIVFGEGYVRLGWNATAGGIYEEDEENGEKFYEGDLEFSNLSPFDVIRDPSVEDNNHDWLIVRTYKNRFALIAKYPELADQLMVAKSKDDMDKIKWPVFTSSKTDLVPVYEFFHKKNDALPEGRYIMYVNNEAVLYDGPLPYREIPVYRISASDILGAPFGYTVMFDLIPIQEAINMLYSTIITNQNAFGVQNILVPKNADINLNQLTGGLNIIEYNMIGGAKPEALNLTQSPPELFKMIELTEQTMETLSGVNSVTRGQPEASLRSASSLALIQSQAILFSSSLQQSYVRLVEHVGTAMIKILQDYAKYPRVAAIAGKSNRTYMKEFSSKDLTNITRVIVEISNPMSKCLAKDTPILMYDGSIKLVQDIVINDKVMGPDSKERTVLNVNSGREMMYDVFYKQKHKKKFLYGCNGSHILSLNYCAADNKYGLKQYEKLDISVKDYMEWPESKKMLFMGYRAPITFEAKEVPFSPYGLGMWLGDGNSDRMTITTADPELKNEWVKIAEDMGYNTYIYDQSDTVKLVGFAKTDEKTHVSILKNLNIYKNKHIPDIYKINSREVQLQVLAGLLDTDGCLSGTCFVIGQTNNKLAEDIVYIARSLGFKTSSIKRTSTCQTGAICDYNSISISGDIWEIPTKLARKQAKNVEKRQINYLNYGITVEKVDIGTYYGFTLKEEPHFVLGDFTVTHNTTAGRLEIANQLLQMGLVKNPDDYLTVLNTGKLDTMLEGPQASMMLIRSENEDMMDGKQVQALATDKHQIHIEEHQVLLADPDLRRDPTLVTLVLNHIQEHLQLLRTTDPGLLAVTGQQPLPPLPSAQGPVPPPGASGPAPKGDAAANVNKELPTGAEANQAQTQAHMPKPPAPFQDLPLVPGDGTGGAPIGGQ